MRDFSLFEHVPIGICILDKNYKVIFWNRCLEEWTEIEKKVIVGASIIDFFPLFGNVSYQSRLENVFAGGPPVIFSSQLHHTLFQSSTNKKQAIHHTTVTAFPHKNSDEYYALFSIEDVTELTGRIQDYRKMRDKTLEEIRRREKTEQELIKAKEKAEKADRLKTTFLANMSHEIRTPLNGILGFTELMKNRTEKSHKNSRFLEIVYQSGKQLMALINDIIDISKIEAGEIKISQKECRINAMMDEVYHFFDIQIKTQTDAAIELRLNKTLPDYQMHIISDCVRIKQVLTNLVSNAVRHTQEGTVEFGYTLQKDKNDDVFLKFYVKDTGEGLTNEEQERIFDRFMQVKGTKKEKQTGSGLGLTISKALVQLLNGKIWVESEKNTGSTFYFTIPYKPIKLSATNEKEVHTSEMPEYQWKDRNFLIVEDINVVAEYFGELFDETDASYDIAYTGSEAIAFCEKNRYDVVLMDIQLPDIDGYQATQTIKKQWPDTKVIAQTAYALTGDRSKAFEAGCDDFLTKPINQDLLFEVIKRHLKQ